MQRAEFMEFQPTRLTMTHSSDSSSDPTSDMTGGSNPDLTRAAMGATLPIDWKQLRQLSDGNEEFELELLEIFWTETIKLLQNAQRAILIQDADQLGYVAHQIKGGSGNLGMTEMARLAKELEQQAKTQDWPNASSCIERLNRSLNYVQKFLQAP
jgi:histidine phosphotransfer protein HptB